MDANTHREGADAALLPLRREIYAKGAVTRDDLRRLLAAARALGFAAAPPFYELLTEVAVDLLVRQAESAQQVSAADSDWLMSELAARPLPATTERRLLVGVLRQAVCVPARLAAFAMATIEQSIIDAATGVSAADVEALRVAAFAATDTSSLHVTRESADALFRVAHATRSAANDPGFADFFARAVGDHLLGIAWQPGTQDGAQKGRLPDAEPPGVGGFLGRMLGDGDRSLDAAAFESPIEANEALIRRRTEAEAGERARAATIAPAQAAWILSKLGPSAAPTAAERALLRFLGAEATAMPPALRALIDRSAEAPQASS